MKKQLIPICALSISFSVFAANLPLNNDEFLAKEKAFEAKEREAQKIAIEKFKSFNPKECRIFGGLSLTNTSSHVARQSTFYTYDDAAAALLSTGDIHLDSTSNGLTVAVCVGYYNRSFETRVAFMLFRDFTYSKDGRLVKISEPYHVAQVKCTAPEIQRIPLRQR